MKLSCSSITRIGNEIPLWSSAFNLKSPLDLRTQRPALDMRTSVSSVSSHLLVVRRCRTGTWKTRSQTCSGRPQRLSNQEDTLVNNSGLMTVKMHHQMYFIMLYGRRRLTFIYHFLVAGPMKRRLWNKVGHDSCLCCVSLTLILWPYPSCRPSIMNRCCKTQFGSTRGSSDRQHRQQRGFLSLLVGWKLRRERVGLGAEI